MLYNFTDKATAITVSSNFLQKKYGGTIIPHARDTDIMKPDSVNVNEVRTRFGLHGKIIMFLGTIRPHKGVEDLIAAVMRINRPDVYCVIVGAEQNDVYVQQLVSHSNERIRFIPPQSFEKIPELLASADIIVIPQRDSLFSQAQLPAKLFDGMAMARPIVATAVSDIPSILDKCGVIVPPGDVEALALALTELLDDPTQATALGLAAREKCIREYGWNAVSDKLCKVIEGL
jgi:glycosyltransferase involved in cell wall biosynthesis